MRSPCQALIKSFLHMRQRRRFGVELRSVLGLLMVYGEWVMDHPAPGANILLTRYCSVNDFTDSEKAERLGRQVRDFGCGRSRILGAEV